MGIAGALAVLHAPAAAQEPAAGSLWSQATLYRDEWGVPHVYAETPQALGFAFGYAQAEDHLPEMLLAYRTANGSAAAVFGEAYADSDAFALKLGHARLAQKAFPQLDPEVQQLCVGFAQGVNLYIVEHGPEMPEWVEGVKPEDLLALWHAFCVSTVPYDYEKPPYMRPSAATTGNAWALAPSRTQDGHALLVINPHQYFEGPFRWYEAHLRLTGMDVAGATLFGLPVILQGHNQVLGWAMTPSQADTADLFQEHFQAPEKNPNDPRFTRQNSEQSLLLMYMANAQRYLVRTASGLEERVVPAFVNSRGPVFEHGSELVSWRIGGYGEFGGIRQLLSMASAQDMAQFQQALQLQQLPACHLLYADAEGNIFYFYNAKTGTRMLPGLNAAESKRLAAVDWKSPIAWELDQPAWLNLVPMAQLPYVANPKQGYLQACNTPPWLTSSDAGLDPRQWPAWFIGEQDNYRAQRARQLLEQGQRSLNDVHTMLYDIVLPQAAELVPQLVTLGEQTQQLAADSHPDLPAGIAMLRDWNFAAATESPAMTYFYAWSNALAQRTGVSPGKPEAMMQAVAQKSASQQTLLMDAAADAARLMQNQFHQVGINWGDVHRIRRGTRDEAMFGASTGGSLFVSGETGLENGHWYANYGYGYAMAVQFGKEPEAFSVSPFGASEVPGSQHYADQLDLFLERRMKKTRYEESDVLKNASSARGTHLRLLPMGVDGEVILHAEQAVLGRVQTGVEAPAPLPAGLAPFTVFIQPEYRPLQARVETSMLLSVPEALCERESLHELQVYAWQEATGWNPVAGQELDPAAGKFHLTGAPAATFAVLGPEHLLKSVPEEAETPAGAAPVSVPTPTPTPAPAPTPPPSLDPFGGTPLAPPVLAEAGTGGGNRGMFLPGPSSAGEDAKTSAAGRKFRFERLDAPASEAADGAAPGGPSGERKFKFELRDKMKGVFGRKDAQPEAEAQPKGPTGGRQFKFLRRGSGKQETAEPQVETVEAADETTTTPEPASVPEPAPEAPPAMVQQEIAIPLPAADAASEAAPPAPDPAPAPETAAPETAAPETAAPETAAPEAAPAPAPTPDPAPPTGQPTGKRVFKFQRK